MAEGGLQDVWFVGANAFPSGHTAFYAGLFFPLLLLLPRAALLWIVPPFFIAMARVIAHDHYLSDVSASLALAAFLAIFLDVIRRKGSLPAPGAIVS
jgi:membrane-associated phospholipid phosphatase